MNNSNKDEKLSDLKELSTRIREHVKSSESERVQAEETLASVYRDEVSALKARRSLEALWNEVRSRPLVEGGARVTATTRYRAQTLWETLSSEIRSSEKRWQELAGSQFWIGLVLAPVTLVLVASLAIGPLPPSDSGSSTVLSLVAVIGLAESYFVFRIHQQARQAQERLTEKRVGLAFLRFVYEDDQMPEERAQSLISAGTAMFLGHYVTPTIPLSHEDMKAALPKI